MFSAVLIRIFVRYVREDVQAFGLCHLVTDRINAGVAVLSFHRDTCHTVERCDDGVDQLFLFRLRALYLVRIHRPVRHLEYKIRLVHILLFAVNLQTTQLGVRRFLHRKSDRVVTCTRTVLRHHMDTRGTVRTTVIGRNGLVIKQSLRVDVRDHFGGLRQRHGVG